MEPLNPQPKTLISRVGTFLIDETASVNLSSGQEQLKPSMQPWRPFVVRLHRTRDVIKVGWHPRPALPLFWSSVMSWPWRNNSKAPGSFRQQGILTETLNGGVIVGTLNWAFLAEARGSDRSDPEMRLPVMPCNFHNPQNVF